MNLGTLVRRGLVHHRRAHLAVGLGAAVGAAVLTGAMLVGDSLRGTLRERALARIGHVESALIGADRFSPADLAPRLGEDVEAHLALPAVVSTEGGARRVRDAQLLAQGSPGVAPAACRVNAALAARLEVGVGDRLLVRVPRPSDLSRDLLLETADDATAAVWVTVERVLPPGFPGDFALASTPVDPLNLVVDLDWLAEQLDREPEANLFLSSAPVEDVEPWLHRIWGLGDVGLAVEELESGRGAELTSDRLFLEAPVLAAAGATDVPTTGLLTYFVNELRAGDRATPYSMVTALGALADGAPLPDFWVEDLADDELLATDWLADDLGVGPGDDVTLTYWVPGPDRRLEEASRTFRVRVIVPLEGDAADPTLMPPFPGMEDAEHCRDWEPGVAIDETRIRDQDEDYWEAHRGTPKAYVNLAAGRSMWANRFGELTAVRAPSGSADALAATIREHLDPASVGLSFRDVRGPALAAATPSNDLGGYFLGLSFFLIASAVLLTALLFAFGVERRAGEVGLLLALGYRPRVVRALMMAEAGAVALVGSALGALLGVGYTALVLRLLRGAWVGAVGGGGLGIELHAPPVTLVTGALGAALTAWFAIALALRGAFRRPARDLLAGGTTAGAGGARGRSPRRALVVGLVAGALGGLVALLGGGGAGAAAAGAFFGAGALLLVAALALGRAALLRAGANRAVAGRVAALGLRGAARRPGRSLATASLVASGVFLVVAVGANRLGPPADPTARESGTGGFALVAESTLALAYDPGSEEGIDHYGLLLGDARVVPMRVRAGDDASCLNLSLPQEPRLVGVEPDALASRGAFAFADVWGDAPEVEGSPWALLAAELDDGAVPAIGDAASVRWTMHKALGDVVTYRDERGEELPVRIVATLAGSMLQGDLVIDEAAFRARFPSESGYRRLLVDAPPDQVEEVSAELATMLEDEGLAVRPAAARLAEFQAVQNTFLAIFEVLGGLGVVLGTLGLGVVLLRNVQDRRGELALTRAVGWSSASIRRLVAVEHALLLLLGLLAGALPAAVAVVPALRGAGGPPPLLVPALLVLGVLVVGGLAVLVATRLALSGPLLAALRSE